MVGNQFPWQNHYLKAKQKHFFQQMELGLLAPDPLSERLHDLLRDGKTVCQIVQVTRGIVLTAVLPGESQLGCFIVL